MARLLDNLWFEMRTSRPLIGRREKKPPVTVASEPIVLYRSRVGEGLGE
jgi:hypothetical protein